MAHLLFDALNGVTLDNQTVQSILESQAQALSSNVSSGTGLATEPPTTVTLDEEDVFQCGKCKKQFTSFSLFMCHKKEHAAVTPTKLHSLSLPLAEELQCHIAEGSSEHGPADSTSYHQLEVDPLDNSITSPDLCQPIILSDADIFSFSIDQSALSVSASQESSLSNVIHGSTLLSTSTGCGGGKSLERDSSNSVANSYNVTALSTQPIILTSELQENSFMTTALPSIQSITQNKICTSQPASNKKENTQNINVLASYPGGAAKSCKVLLQNAEYVERSIDCGALLLECKSEQETDQYRTETIDSAGTVLLDYANDDRGKTCKVLLANGEYAETSIEYIDSTVGEGIIEYSDLTEGGSGGVTVSLFDVVEADSGQTVTLGLPKDVDGRAEAVPDSSSSAIVTSSCMSVAADSGSSRSKRTAERSAPSRSSVRLPKLECGVCGKEFAKNFDLQQHMRSHTGEKPFQCVVCGRAFSQKSNVKKHMATHKVWPNGLSRTLPKEPVQVVNGTKEKTKDLNIQKPSKESTKANENDSGLLIIDRSYVCQYCNTSFPSYFELKTHMKKHSHQKVYICVQRNCQKTFKDLDSFVEHTKLHTNEVQYCCHICSKKFNTLTDLGIHQYTHDPNIKANLKTPVYFLCVKCKSKFTSSKALEHHLSTTNHHFPCARCGKVFSCERYLRRHLPTHGPPESFVCSTCGKGFRTEQYLNTHRLIHSGIKPYICMHCPAAFNRKDKLVRHSLIHQTVKKFKCPFHNYLGCSKEFNRQDKLKLHVLTHNAAKSFHCRKCNKMFQKQALLREHDRIHHSSDAPFACTRCGTRFRKKVHLSTHSCSGGEPPDGQTQASAEAPSRAEPPAHPRLAPHGLRPRRIRNTKRNANASTNTPTPASTNSKKTKPNQSNTSNTQPESALTNSSESDDVPTIEIIVMPVTLNQKESENLYRVMFPGGSGSNDSQIKFNNGTADTIVSFSDKCVTGLSGEGIIADLADQGGIM